MRCLICGSPSLAGLYAGIRDRYRMASGEFAFLRCDACGSATLVPPPAPDAIAGLYPPQYAFMRPSAGASRVRAALAAVEWRLFYGPTYRRRVALFRALTGLHSGRVLEVGCGSGLLLSQFRNAGYEVEGVELSAEDAAYAREEFGLAVRAGSVETVALESGRYDAVVMINVLEHILDPAAVLTRMHEVLRPGGWMVAGVPVLDCIAARVLGARWGAVTEAPRHVSIPSYDGAVGLLRRAGFETVRSAPSPLAERGGDLVLSLLASAATPMSYGRSGVIRAFAGRLAGAALMPLAMALASVEQLPWAGPRRTSTMLFGGRKPTGGARDVP
jgi:SAM-dependent methyltransferase